MVNFLGKCICKKWPLYVGAWDEHGYTTRCFGCKKIPSQCTCR